MVRRPLILGFSLLGACAALFGAGAHAQEQQLNQSTSAAIDLTFQFCPQYVVNGDALLEQVDPGQQFGLGRSTYTDGRLVWEKAVDDGAVTMVYQNEPRECEVQLVSAENTSVYFNYVGAALTRSGFELSDQSSDDKVRYGQFSGTIDGHPFLFTLAVDHVLPRVLVTVTPGQG